jgi:hypothetical protein
MKRLRLVMVGGFLDAGKWPGRGRKVHAPAAQGVWGEPC